MFFYRMYFISIILVRKPEISYCYKEKKLKVIKVNQSTVTQMLQQTSVAITYFVDFPTTAEGILRHLTFASKAADRKLYSTGTNIILSQFFLSYYLIYIYFRFLILS